MLIPDMVLGKTTITFGICPGGGGPPSTHAKNVTLFISYASNIIGTFYWDYVARSVGVGWGGGGGGEGERVIRRK